MSNFESIEVTIPCRECESPLKARCRKKNAEDPSRGGASLIGTCDEHGEMKMKLMKDPDSGDQPWHYMNRFDVELGRGNTPQAAVDNFHGQTSPEPSATSTEAPPEQEQLSSTVDETTSQKSDEDTAPEMSQSDDQVQGVSQDNPEVEQDKGELEEEQQSDEREPNEEASNEPDESKEPEPSTDEQSHQEAEQESMEQRKQPDTEASQTDISQDDPNQRSESGQNPIATLEDLPKWFRTQSRSIDWLREMDKEPAEIFSYRFVIIGRFNRSKNGGALSIIGTDQRKDVIEMAKKGMENDSEIVLIRDQKDDTFLKAEMKFVLIEISQPNIEGNEKVQHIDTIKAKRSTA